MAGEPWDDPWVEIEADPKVKPSRKKEEEILLPSFYLALLIY